MNRVRLMTVFTFFDVQWSILWTGNNDGESIKAILELDASYLRSMQQKFAKTIE